MRTPEVLELLGRPSWAVTSEDSSEFAEPDVPLQLIWKNGNCDPVLVMFDLEGTADGWSEGRAVCLNEEYTFLPEDDYACPREDRPEVCG